MLHDSIIKEWAKKHGIDLTCGDGPSIDQLDDLCDRVEGYPTHSHLAPDGLGPPVNHFVERRNMVAWLKRHAPLRIVAAAEHEMFYERNHFLSKIEQLQKIVKETKRLVQQIKAEGDHGYIVSDLAEMIEGMITAIAQPAKGELHE